MGKGIYMWKQEAQQYAPDAVIQLCVRMQWGIEGLFSLERGDTGSYSESEKAS